MSEPEPSVQASRSIGVTGLAQHEAWLSSVLPPAEQLRPGLWSLPLPIPIPSLRYVNCYVFETDAGPVLVDPGWNSEESWAALCQGLSAIGLAVEATSLVLATHFHPDHLGLAGRVRSVSGAPVALHRRDAERLTANREQAGERAAQLLREMVDRIGIPEAEAAEFLQVVADDRYSGLQEPDIFLEDGEFAPVRDWRLQAVLTPGHSPGHLCFLEERANLLLSGDHVLARISPNVSFRLIGAEPTDNPLEDYLASLQRVAKFQPLEVLPAHLWRFSPLALRVEELLVHHGERLEEVRALVAGGAGTTWEVARALTWSRPWSTFATRVKRAALGETLAHLVALQKKGLLVHQLGHPERWSLP